MRTTLSLDERARREKRSAGEVLSDLARQALTHEHPVPEPESFHGFEPIPHRGAAVSNALIDKIREDEPA